MYDNDLNAAFWRMMDELATLSHTDLLTRLRCSVDLPELLLALVEAEGRERSPFAASRLPHQRRGAEGRAYAASWLDALLRLPDLLEAAERAGLFGRVSHTGPRSVPVAVRAAEARAEPSPAGRDDDRIRRRMRRLTATVPVESPVPAVPHASLAPAVEREEVSR
ncbi:MAG: hypothetical protein ACKVU4_12275 [Phycisphaerales bacterium]